MKFLLVTPIIESAFVVPFKIVSEIFKSKLCDKNKFQIIMMVSDFFKLNFFVNMDSLCCVWFAKFSRLC